GFSLPLQDKLEFQEFFKIPIVDYYGLTETCGSCIVQEKDRFETNLLGKSVDSLAMVINERGEEAEEGELLIFSNNLTSGYFNRPELTQKKFKKGWFHTGDLARINSAGDIYLKGRKDRLIINREGDNIYPEEIEEGLKKDPKVNEVYVGPLRSLNDIGVLISLHKEFSELEKEVFHHPKLSGFNKKIHFVKELPKNKNKKIDLTTCNQILKSLEETNSANLL
ncbi:MAG: AMP-binding protein, partial [Bdellovibrionota bacterium]|nr:AMP-binding protein [Bdellovibrionota bacterium]